MPVSRTGRKSRLRAANDDGSHAAARRAFCLARSIASRFFIWPLCPSKFRTIEAWGLSWVFTLSMKCWPPKGGQGYLMSPPLSRISGLSFHSPFPSPLLFFCTVLLLFLSCYFSAIGQFSWLSFQKTQTFFVKSEFFLYGSCWAARRW